MQEASGETVPGDFDDARFTQFGVESRFYRDGDRFMVRTDGPDGKMQDYPIKYTFGVHPLQQYLIEFPGGRLQALDIAWDSRTEDEGGQRWIHLHPEDPVPHDDVLHWTGPNLNWNYMCADCHSTNLRKGYDSGKDSYRTTWSEIDVSCEACHGPGSEHLRWAQAMAEGTAPADGRPDMGLTVNFDERKDVSWTIDPATGRATRSAPRETSREIQVCARCHSRRSQLTDDAVAGQPFLDAFHPAMLTQGLYHADGQILDEVYVWGSFLQSKMHRAGVTCSDCHDPHSADLRLPGEMVCYQCHEAGRYASERHHFHPEGSSGASCVECHMPATNYMVVDARHDHGFRVPRPAQSVRLGTPNACTKCHEDKGAQWAAEQVTAWYGPSAAQKDGYAEAMYAARSRLPGAGKLLQEIASDARQSDIARATALAELGAYADRGALALIREELNAGDPLRSLGALAALETTAPGVRILAVPLLWDDHKAIRIEAAGLLSQIPADRFPPEVRERLLHGINEYVAAQELSAERPESQVNLAGIYTALGDDQKAEAAYRRALELQPRFIPTYVNMAQFLSDRQREQEAEGLLRQGPKINPESADLNHALGLSLARGKKADEALAVLAQGADQAPQNARYSYVYAVALQSSGQLEESLRVLESANQRHAEESEILYALAAFNRDAGRSETALRYARELATVLPDDPAIKALIRELTR
jgi:predicted CXXCH cytochrome family protein